MFAIARSERFDDVDEDAGYAYHGWNHEVLGANVICQVRIYDDEPGRLTVVSPTNARVVPEARELVTYLLSSLGGSTVLFYDPASGSYRAIDCDTLEFL